MPTALLVGGGVVDGLTPLVFDATAEVTPRYSNTVTRHPVETGNTISDHIFRNNTEIDIRGVIANESVGNVFQDGFRNNRVQTVHDLLTSLRETGELIAVSTEFDSFQNCAITQLRLPRTAEVGDTLQVEMTVEQLQVVTSTFVQVEGLQPRVNRGQKTPVSSNNPNNSDTDDAKTSRFERALEDTFGFFGTPEGGTSLVPLASDSNYNQSVIIEDTSYDIGLQYNDREQAWYADIGPTGFDPVVNSVKVTTSGDTLKPFQHLEGVPDGFLTVFDLETGIGRVNREEFNNEGRYNLVYLQRGDYDRIIQGVPA